METIERRIASLELQNHRQRRILLGIGVLALVVAFTAAAAPDADKVPNVLRAHAFEVVDAAGKVMWKAGIGEDGAGETWVQGTTKVQNPNNPNENPNEDTDLDCRK